MVQQERSQMQFGKCQGKCAFSLKRDIISSTPQTTFWPINAFPIVHADIRVLLSKNMTVVAFVESGLPSLVPRSFFVALGGPGYSENSNTACINGLWKTTEELAGEEAEWQAAVMGIRGGSTLLTSLPCSRPRCHRILQASCRSSAARKPPVRTVWSTV